jgi:hypothetical protein
LNTKTTIHTTIVKEKTPDFFDYLTVGLPVITFFLGYWITHKLTQRRENKNSEEYYDFFLAYLIEQQEAIDLQLGHLLKVSRNISPRKIGDPIDLKLALQPFYLYDSLNKEKLLAAYKYKKISSKNLMTKLEGIELTRVAMANYEISIKSYLRERNRIIGESNRILMELDSLLQHHRSDIIDMCSQEQLDRLQEWSFKSPKKENKTLIEILETYSNFITLVDDLHLANPDERLQRILTLHRELQHISTNKTLAMNQFKANTHSTIKNLSETNLLD